MCSTPPVLKTIKIRSVWNGHFMIADMGSKARVYCRPGKPLLFYQITNDDGTVRFQITDRSLVDKQLFLSCKDRTGTLRLQATTQGSSFRVATHDRCKTLESVLHPDAYVSLQQGESPRIEKGGNPESRNAQWIFEESDFIVQPIFAFGHMCNDLKYVKETLDRGGNAIECDIEVLNPQESSRPYDFIVSHSEFAPSHGGGRTALKDYLAGLGDYMPRLAAVMFDCKQSKGVNYTKYGTDLAEAILEAGITPSRCIISVPKPECRAMLSTSAVVQNGFQRDVSMVDIQPVGKDHRKWLETAEEMGCNWLGMGITNFVLSPTKFWLGPLRHSIFNKRKHAKVCKVYFWTLDSSASIRKILQAGADGIICNIDAIFHDGLPNIKLLVDHDLTRRMATASDSLSESYNF